MISNKNIKISVLVLIILNLYACNIFKKNIRENKNAKEKDLTKILKKVDEKNLKYETLILNFSGNYKEGKNRMPLKGIVKIKKNNFIFITVRPFLGIEVAKILMTRDSVKYIDKINKRYFISGYEYLNKKFGLKADLSVIEKLFTGKYFFYPPESSYKDYDFLKTDTSYVLKKEGKIFHDLIFDKIFRLTENKFSTSDNLYASDVKYSDFQETNKTFFPQKIFLNLKKRNQIVKASVIYKTIKINDNVSFKFKIPDNYKKIKIE